MKNFEAKKFSAVICIFFSLLVFSSCKTTQRFSGNAELTIFVIDENDCPVINTEVNLQSGGVSKLAVTNQSGLCVFYDLTADDYFVFTSKEGFADSLTKICFVERTEVFCIKVFGAEYIFDQAELLYEKSAFEAAIELLEKVNAGKNQILQNVKSFYLAYGYASSGKNKKARKELDKIKAEPPFDDSAQKYKLAIQKMLE